MSNLIIHGSQGSGKTEISKRIASDPYFYISVNQEIYNTGKNLEELIDKQAHSVFYQITSTCRCIIIDECPANRIEYFDDYLSKFRIEVIYVTQEEPSINRPYNFRYIRIST